MTILFDILIGSISGITSAFFAAKYLASKYKTPAESPIVYKHVTHVVSHSAHRICSHCKKEVARFDEDGDRVVCANCKVGGK